MNDTRLRVLLVDDIQDVRLMVRALLSERREVLVVAEAADGREAITLAAALQPDLIVLDVAMPVLSGFAALPGLLAASPDSRIVMFSAVPRELHYSAPIDTVIVPYMQATGGPGHLVDDLLAGTHFLDFVLQHGGTRRQENFAAEARSVSAARRFAVGTLADWDQGDLADTITLLVSELVTNAIQHADAAPNVTVRLLPDRVHVQVADNSPGELRVPPMNEDATSGRGLALVETLAREWGSVILTEGKVVWFDVARV